MFCIFREIAHVRSKEPCKIPRDRRIRMINAGAIVINRVFACCVSATNPTRIWEEEVWK